MAINDSEKVRGFQGQPFEVMTDQDEAYQLYWDNPVDASDEEHQCTLPQGTIVKDWESGKFVRLTSNLDVTIDEKSITNHDNQRQAESLTKPRYTFWVKCKFKITDPALLGEISEKLKNLM